MNEPAQPSLDELRTMAAEGNSEARLQFAKALRSKHWHLSNEGKLADADAPLAELRTLASSDGAQGIAEQFAASLNNAQHFARTGRLMEAFKGYVAELRELSNANSENAVIGDHYSQGLYSFLLEAKKEPGFGESEANLEELQALSDRFPNHGPIREWLGKALLSEVTASPNSNEGAAFLRRLGALAGDHGDEPVLREVLGQAYYNEHHEASKQDNFARAAVSHQALKVLAEASNATEKIWVRFSRLLYSEVYFACEHANRPVADSALNELRLWQSRHPESTEIANNLTRALTSRVKAALDEDDTKSAGEALVEIRELGRRFPDAANIPHGLVEVLYEFHLWGIYDGNPESYSESYLQEIRQIYIDRPTDTFVHEWLAHALGMATTYAWFRFQPFKARRLWEEFVFVADTDVPEPKLRARLDDLKTYTSKQRLHWAWDGFRKGQKLMSIVFALIVLVAYLWDLFYRS